MLSRYATLSLSRMMADADEAVLVASTRWPALRVDGGFHEIDSRKALWLFENLGRHSFMDVRHFAATIGHFDIHRMSDDQVLALIRNALRDGRVVAIQKGAADAAVSSATAELRAILKQVEARTRGKLAFQGRNYKLVVDVDLAKLPGRDCYDVVSQTEARAVLTGIAKESPPAAGTIAKAWDKLTKDWRAPFSEPDGLILLRRIPVQATAPKDDGPAITPSQMKALLGDEKTVTFFARFVDEHGKALSEFTGNLAHGSDPDSDMTFSGSGFAKVPLKGATQAWLTLPDDATNVLVDTLKKRWKKIGGKVDETWKTKEESLAEVLLQKGRLSELQLDAEKKHTFMLRPPVALARMRGMYFDTNKCFLLPTAVASLKRLVEIYELHPDSELLVVGHTDTAGSESYNLDLSADRADAMRAYLHDDADAWLAWYKTSVREGKRWGENEDALMIDALVPEDDFVGKNHVSVFQEWHNGDSPDAREPALERRQPKGWEKLKIDGILGPKTRRQLILDYMNLDKTSLPDDARVVTYGCGEYFPLESEEGNVDSDAKDDEDVQFNRRVEIFFFAKPFGILPAVPSVADGESPDKAIEATKGDKLYPEWRTRSTRRYIIETTGEVFRLRLCDYELAPYAERPFAFCLDGYPEIRGTTDKDGFAIVDAPPASAQGHVELWPDDETPENKVTWQIDVGAIFSAGTPKGAATRLANLDYFDDEPSDDMTDELREGITSFQTDNEDLEISGELDGPTCARLRSEHDCEVDGDTAATESTEGA